ncbi:MAG: 3-phosphoshikimate 1-carboxyvinyltransferase [Clostridia bacterium]|nr:3-phosphoshikimate 1-carboxyvinyltransferase [Clostridia bacterium]
MDIKITPSVLSGTAEAPASKSVAHRMLICAALAGGKSRIKINKTSEDIEATASCLASLGVKIEKDGATWTVTPPDAFPKEATLDCGESGSTLRFMLPVVSALGITATLTGHGRLPERPIAPLLDEMKKHGISCGDGFPIKVSGRLTGGKYKIAGNISSQFITGLLLALPLCDGESVIEVIPPVESKPYIDITTSVLADFGVKVKESGNIYTVSEALPVGGAFIAEGDWSNAAFLLALGARVSGLNPYSVQGDRKILDVLTSFGAKIKNENGTIQADISDLHSTDVDASDIPDLVPVISALAASADGETKIYNAARLRLKESDRIETTVQMVNSLGGEAAATQDGLIIKGKPQLAGGTVDGCGDHRIVMSAAVMAPKCENPVVITGAQAVNKSYPEFFNEYTSLGGKINVL